MPTRVTENAPAEKAEPMEDEDPNPASLSLSSSSEEEDEEMKEPEEEEDEEMEVDEQEEREEEEEEIPIKRRSTRVRNPPLEAAPPPARADGRRTSSRANKFRASMAEPTMAEGLSMLTVEKKKKGKRSGGDDDDDDDDFDESDESPAVLVRRSGRSRTQSKDMLVDSGSDMPLPKQQQRRSGGRGRGGRGDSLGRRVTRSAKGASPHKSPARRHSAMHRRVMEEEESSESGASETSESEQEEVEEEQEESLKIQRIIATRTEKRAHWKEICKDMNTSEVHYGSRWFQNASQVADTEEDDGAFEERFLVKWDDVSFLHCSWETQDDILEQVESSRSYFTTFFRKSSNGLLYSADERCDGDYFDPAYTQIERILEVNLPQGWDEDVVMTAETEDTFTSKSFGMILDKGDPKFDDGTGRDFLIKWQNLPYSAATYEFERDLIMMDVDYKDHVKAFLKRNRKPTKQEKREHIQKGDRELRRLYKIFGEKNVLQEEEREKQVVAEQQELQDAVYKNGGQLRDYQAEGVAWMISNFVNKRSSILADEMGLGKTLQTAAVANLLLNKVNLSGPMLIVAPLSTLAHWQREFESWTDLNTIVYHGSAEDRKCIREYEFAYECDRPVGGIGFNQLYLKKCGRKSQTKAESPWMIDVVVTTPEIMVADDYAELTAVPWELLVVDEAHRLKNHQSKLAVTLRSDRFTFKHKILLTGTPIQNDVQEFWTLLNFIEPNEFDDEDDFVERFGDMKSKERVDELHEEIRPYILRRLKEDVEKSVPPKEETLIEVELTVAQKQYYRALYEKNVKFLYKNKRKALDGPSLNNLAMQLRKCCNHLFLLNGVEEEFRAKQLSSGEEMQEGDFLTKASGKLVLLDKLLPRLKEEGHRVLLFSQFKIMLDILEDYFHTREMKFERIDGSITGKKRQQAIDRFQAEPQEGREAPFVMMLSTRAGGVGINLTAADTCIIFDSDWNPQNDLQAQARCHRIGQTKSVKVYRLLTRKTYEMQMFHMSSLKMGLDQVVLKGFETGASGEGALSKDEVEKLLKHGAYDIFNEDKSGTAEAESNEFVQQDIDSILQRHSRTVVHENTGSKSNAKGGTFSKASFKLSKSPDAKGKQRAEDIDIDDPDFWKRVVGEPAADEEADLTTNRRQRTQIVSYAELDYQKQLEKALLSDDESDSDASDGEENEQGSSERLRWGGDDWKKDDVESLVKGLCTFGYGNLPWEDFVTRLEFTKTYEIDEIKRMCWSIVLMTMLETAEEDAEQARKREVKAAEKKKEEQLEDNKVDGGMLAEDRTSEPDGQTPDFEMLKEQSFKKLWSGAETWVRRALTDAVAFAASSPPRGKDVVDKILRRSAGAKEPAKGDVGAMFAATVWPMLKNRGWKGGLVSEGEASGKRRYSYQGKEYSSPESVLHAAVDLHPELKVPIESILASAESTRQGSQTKKEEDRVKDLDLKFDAATPSSIRSFLERYAPTQFLHDRKKPTRIRLPRKVLSVSSLLHRARSLVREATEAAESNGNASVALANSLIVDKRSAVPHPAWTSRHDAVLILAMAKHGWIDQEKSSRAIIDDPSIKWGPPFDSLEDSTMADSAAPRKESASHLLAAAHRAASFLNGHRSMLDELKSFNRHHVIRAYGLSLPEHQDDSEQQPHVQNYVVDPASLQAAANSESERSPSPEPIELPTKKDLVRRAKFLLSRTTAVSGAEAAIKEPVRPSHDFAVLDQREMSNVLLAEMLRSLVKENHTSKHRKHLCSLAAAEAKSLVDSLSSCMTGDSAVDGDLTKRKGELVRITRHIDLIKRNMARNVRQYKNVLRVVLGEEPQKSKNANEGLFPVERAFPQSLPTIGVKRKTKSPKLVEPSGDKAIELARKRLTSSFSSQNAPTASGASTLELTEIETLILSAACALGIPVWHADWESAVQQNPFASSGYGRLTWGALGEHIKSTAAKTRQTIQQKLVEKQTEYEQQAEETESRRSALASLTRVRQRHDETQSVYEQALEYAAEPETLAKKCVLLLAKVKQRMTALNLAPSFARSDMGLGVKVIAWLSKEIGRWANALDLVDDRGHPLAFTAMDFLEDVAEDDRESITICTVFDKKGCRAVASQIALMTRIRSIFALYEGTKLHGKIQFAVKKVHSAEGVWESQPEQWVAESDYVLLHRLMDCGLTDELLESTKNFGRHGYLATMPYSDKENYLTRGDIQVRANQLARELHEAEEVAKSFRILEDRRNELPAAAKKKASPKPARHQGRLESYFAAVTDSNVQGLVDASDSDVQIIEQQPKAVRVKQDDVSYSDVEVIASPSGNKRKGEGPWDDPESPGKLSRLS